MNDKIHMQSGVSGFTGEPFVQLHWGEMHAQFTPEEARAHAFAILETVEAAESDAFLFKFTREKLGATQENAARILIAFREYRESRQPPPEIPEREN